MEETFDAVVIGAGFGGLSAALSLAHGGAKVALLERLRYPGGCASTFERGGSRYESGATLFSGFAEGQLFHRWIRDHALPVKFETFDPLVEYRSEDVTFGASPEREEFLHRICAIDGVPEAPTRRFFKEQAKVAKALWELFDDPAMLPPFNLRNLSRHLLRSPRYLPLLRVVGLPLATVLHRHGLADVEPLKNYLDAVCQITVQCGVDEVEAPFALGAMDYYFRGTGHIHGGIGELATALATSIDSVAGSEVHYSRAVKSIRRKDELWHIDARRGALRARHVVANLTPHALGRLWGEETPRLTRMKAEVETGWGACMLYLRLPKSFQGRSEAHHLQLVGDTSRPLQDGNHVFCSLSGEDEHRNEEGERTVTCSTHVRMSALRGAEDQGAFVEGIQQRMQETIALRAPELLARTTMKGSPRTFERFTGRDFGYVGGIPRRAGLSNYRDMSNDPFAKGLHMVGDSVFPGQSTLATALGGLKVAERILSTL
ncbi:MAG: phytoene desaturase family protein [Polyangiales bacterium]